MRLTRIFSLIMSKRQLFNTPVLKRTNLNYRLSSHNRFDPKFILSTAAKRQKSDRNHSDSDEEPDLDLFDDKYFQVDQGFARDLYKNSPDLLMNRIYDCASIQELLNVFNSNRDNYKSEHLVLSVLVLWDLKKVYREINNASPSGGKSDKKVSEDFLNALNQNASFLSLLRLIQDKIDDLDQFNSSYLLLFLNNLGMDIKNPLLQDLSWRLRQSLRENFEISTCARYLESIFQESTHSSYYMAQDLVPLVFNSIDSCNSAEILSDLTTSLHQLYHLVTKETVQKYKDKVEFLVEKGELKSTDYKVILKIASFLTYPKWRDKNTTLISKLIILIKDSLSNLNVSELVIVSDIFYKLQEPALILNDLQRCSSKFIQEMDGMSKEKIQLLSALVYFTSPHMRGHFQTILDKYVTQCNNLDNLIRLRRILTSVKISDSKLCKKYWDKILKAVNETPPNELDVIKLVQNYSSFNIDVGNFRHEKFERKVLQLIEKEARFGLYSVLPHKLIPILGFALNYSDNDKFIEYLLKKIENNWTQILHMDALKLSLYLKYYLENEDTNYTRRKIISRVNCILDRVIQKEMTKTDNWKNSALLKACIYKRDTNNQLLLDLLQRNSSFTEISSKSIENVSYNLMSTGALLPEIIEELVAYITDHPDAVLAFNTGKLLYLCYYLGYQPKNEKFFQTTANIITRDQERMGGLALIQCALGLCYFNELPNSLIKSIFNVEFMDKLDAELANCYSKDRYPQRVRHNLMQLNRAVCLDYPDANVPWFHQKYAEEVVKNPKGDKLPKRLFYQRVKDSLDHVLAKKGTITENLITPYGYLVDFALEIGSSRLAILLLPEYAYTKFDVQLRGRYQLLIRHLEILGYRVITVNFSDWIALYYGEERSEFLSSLIWPKTVAVGETNTCHTHFCREEVEEVVTSPE